MSRIMIIILTATITAAALFIIIMKLINKDGRYQTKYDERQLIARGRAYMYGFAGMMLANVVMMILTSQTSFERLFSSIGYFIPIFVGIIVQISFSIFSDSYIGLNTNMKKYVLFMLIVSLINIAIPLFFNELIVDGVLQTSFINLCCGFLFLIVAVELLIKKMIDARED